MSRGSWQAARAVFLAAIMILSVFAAGIAFSGSAAAETVSVTNSDSLQTEIDDAGDDDVLIVEDGTYDQITIDRQEDASNLTIRAADGASPRIEHSANDGTPAVAIDQDDITLEGFTIKRTNSNNVAQAVRVAGDDVQLTNNTYQLGGEGTNDAAVAVLTDSSGAAGNPPISDVTISDVTISGGEIITNDSSQTGVLVADNGDASFGGAGSVSVSDVTFTANVDSTQVLELDTGGDIINIADTLDNNEFNRAAAPDETASDADLSGFSVDGLISTEIQDAVDNAASGSTIQVASGTYNEQVIISGASGLTITGSEESTEIQSPERGELDTTPTESVDTTTKAPLAILGSSDITITGIEIDGQNQGTEGEAFFGIFAENSSVTLSDLRVVNTTPNSDGSPSGNQANDGIRLSTTDDADRSSIIRDVTVENFDKNGITVLNDGSGNLSVEVTGSTVIGAGPTDATAQNGISLTGVSATVTDNTVVNLSYTGPDEANSGYISTTSISDSEFTGNTLRDEVPSEGAPVGIYLTGSDDVTFAGNTIEGTAFGIFPNSGASDTEIESNTLRGQDTAILLLDSDDESIRSNTFEDNIRHLRDYDTETDLQELVADNTFDTAAYVEGGQQFLYSSIGDAVNGDLLSGGGAEEGDTIVVEPGTYEESVTISTQNVTLEGPNAGTPGYSDDRGEEAVISRTDKPGSGGAAVTITADETTVDGFQVESDAQDGISVPQAVDDVVITNNRITSVEGNTFGSEQGARATGNGIAFGLPKDTDATVTGAVVTDNEITGVTTTDLAASDDRTTANGIQVLTRDNDVERMDISGNVIRDLEPGASGDTGDSRARGIVVNVGGDGPVGEADEFNIDDNEIRNLTGDGGGGSDLAGIALFETKGVRPYVGPTNFSIEGNTIDDVANEGSGPPTALFVGGYEELGNHIVRYNNFQNGLVVRFSGDQPGFSRSEGETLNARLNWWNSTDGPAGENSSTAASGFLALDPFLTAPSDQVDKVNDEGEIITRQFGTDLSLESGVNAIAFPAPSERSLSESVNLTNVEAVYRYDNSDGGWTQLNGSDPTPSALDVYVIVVEEGETAEVVMEFENDRPENPVFESQVISGGWNLIAPTEADRSDDEAFGTQRAEISTIPPNQPFDDPSSQPYGVEDRGFSPYEGYWAFIDDDPGQSTLASNTFDGITYEEFLENADIVQLGN